MFRSARIFEQALGSGIFAPTGGATASVSNDVVDDDGDDDDDAGNGRWRNVVDDKPSEQCVLDYERELGIRVEPIPARPAGPVPAGSTTAADKVDIMADLLQFRLLERVAEM